MFVAPSITETVLPLKFVTYMNPLSGLKAMPNGCDPTGMVAHNRVCCAVYHGDGVAIKFVTYIKPLSGLKAMPIGPFPTGMVATTVFVAPSITETVLHRSLPRTKSRCLG